NVTNTVILSDYNPLNYTTERIAALSWDGQEIPVSLLYKRNRVLKDGTAPLLLQVYGSYGIALQAKFSKYDIDLADQGFVVANAHVRGGGALGLQWHHAGWKMNKMNTIEDTISVIDHLVAKNYTSYQRVALTGASAGGLAVAAIANLTPTKVRAVVADVPFLDCLTKLLNSSQPGVVENYVEFGDPRSNKTVYDYIQSYSPYDNIHRDVNFPHILVTTHLNDARIRAWGPVAMHADVGKHRY
ncbi:prolyl oligopeptidase, partial [Helicosporidium sp. ATCC 50920]